MRKFLIPFVMLIHGLIHSMGFFKAFNLIKIEEITGTISKPFGIIWLLVMLLFLGSSFLYLKQKNLWMVIGGIAILVSQILIIMTWQDSQFGTIANILILIGILWTKFRKNEIKPISSSQN